MQPILILVVAFAVLADAQWNYTGGFYHQQKAAAQVVGSNTGSNTGFNTGSGSGLGASLGTPRKEAAQVVGSSSNAGGSTASFTQYGPCNSPSLTSCAWYSKSGYNAAISQAVYGGAPGTGASAACGICWKLTPDAPGANEIVVKVNNLCPNDGHNPLCSQPESELFFPFALKFKFTFLDLRVGLIKVNWGLADLNVSNSRC